VATGGGGAAAGGAKPHTQRGALRNKRGRAPREPGWLDVMGTGLRIMTWNVKAQHQQINQSADVSDWLWATTDIIAFTETGHRGKAPGAIRGFKCLACSRRPYAAVSGGVALHVRSSIASHVKVVEDNPALGMLWFRIRLKEGRDVYACAAYLPHPGSTYLKREGGSLSAEAHMLALSKGVAKYRESGEVLVLGDLNARTSQADDRGGHDADGGDPVVARTAWDITRSARVGQRTSADHGSQNAHGKDLISLCRDSGIVILNGRLPGDEGGAHTFHADTRNLHSVIDYFIASPALVFSEAGAPLEGASLRVHTRPILPGWEGTFDHCPVVLTISATAGESATTPNATMPCTTPTRFKWPEGGESAYARALEGVAADIRGAREAPTVDEERALLEGAVARAAHALHESGEAGPVLVRPAEGDATVRPHNTWYDQECKDARQAYRKAERAHGAQSPLTAAAFRASKQTTRRVRRAWENQEYDTMLKNMHNAPKKFWRKINPGSQAGGLRDVDGWTTYFGGLVGTEHAHGDLGEGDNPFADPTEGDKQRARVLNAWITEDEVSAALMGMRAGKAPGVDGMPVEFYQRAWAGVGEAGDGGAGSGSEPRHALLEAITHLLNRVFREGYPKEWHMGAVTPVPKKGNLDERDNYRGITVGGALAKLYSLVLLHRLDDLAERGGHRAAGQAGFRKGRGTPDNAFILQHIIEKRSNERKPLYTAFIDFRKAYDCVHRQLLWECLKSIGVGGAFLAALTSLYDGSGMCVRIDGTVGPGFTTRQGVMQGDPMSPLLFGLFIDSLEAELNTKLPGDGIPLGTGAQKQLLRLLLYADDLVLMAETPEALQRLLDELHTFCKTHALTVNVRKSEGVVYNNQHCPIESAGGRVTLKYAGEDLPMKHEFTYLGMMFGNRRAIAAGMEKRRGAGQRARFALARRYDVMGLHNVGIKSYLFNALVRPVINYGCEIWGPGMMAGAGMGAHGIFSGAVDKWETAGGGGGPTHAARRNWRAMETLHLQSARESLHIRSCGQQLSLLATELGWRPLATDWLRQAARFWTKTMLRPDGDLLKEAMRESWELAAGGVQQCWVAQLSVCLSNTGHTLEWGQEVAGIAQLMETAVAGWLASEMSTPELPEGTDQLSVVRSVPDAWSHRYKMLTYRRWMADDSGSASMLLTGLNCSTQITTLARFRMGLHEFRLRRGVTRGRQSQAARGCVASAARGRTRPM
jgi:hypothetical protein